MKKILMFSILAFLVSAIFAQTPTLEDLPNKVFRDQKRDIKAVEKQAKQDEKAGYDILPDPLEVPLVVPQEYATSILAIESWQTNTQRVKALEQRIATEFIYPVHVRISDSGVDETHTDLKDFFKVENNWTTEGNQPGQHGTHVAGDVIQFLWPALKTGNLTLGDDKSLLASGSGSFSWASNMFNSTEQDTKDRTAKGQSVIWNCSWGGGTQKIDALEDAMKKQVDAGALIIAAAGNSGGAVGYPGNSEYTFAVSSLDESLVISSFSSRGPEVTNAAGGRNIYSTLPGGQYGFMSGTSMASPSFAAFVALARGKWGINALPNKDAIIAYYKKVSTKVGNGDALLYGAGYAFMQAILDTKPDGGTPPPNPDPDPDPEPPSGTYYSAGLSDAGYFMRWRYEDETAFRYLYVSQIEWESVGEKSEFDTHEAAGLFVGDFFKNRAIVLPKDMFSYSATWWTGQFMEYVARNAGLTLQVFSVVAKDEFGQYKAVGFDKADIAARGFFGGVRFIDLN